MPTWFISHPSGGAQHAPTFFNAINTFVQSQSKTSVVFPHSEGESVQKTKDSIAAADLVLVEVSMSSTGSGIELGWANAAGKPIIAFHQGGAQPSPALHFVTQDIIVYITEEHILEKLGELQKR